MVIYLIVQAGGKGKKMARLTEGCFGRCMQKYTEIRT